MSKLTCVHEHRVVQAARAGALAEELSRHAAGCTVCSAALTLCRVFKDDREAAERSVVAPAESAAAAALWHRARAEAVLEQELAARRRLTRPGRALHHLAGLANYALFALAALALAGLLRGDRAELEQALAASGMSSCLPWIAPCAAALVAGALLASLRRLPGLR